MFDSCNVYHQHNRLSHSQARRRGYGRGQEFLFPILRLFFDKSHLMPLCLLRYLPSFTALALYNGSLDRVLKLY